MPQYEAKGNIRHNHRRYKAGDVVELKADEKKSDLFVLVEAKAEKPKADKPKPEPKAKKEPSAPVVASAPEPSPVVLVEPLKISE